MFLNCTDGKRAPAGRAVDQKADVEDVDGAAAVLFPLPELKLCLFSGTGYSDGFNAGLMKSSSLESLEAPSHNKLSSSSTYRRRSSNISPSGKRYRVIRAYPNPDSSLYLLKRVPQDLQAGAKPPLKSVIRGAQCVMGKNQHGTTIRKKPTFSGN